MNSELHGQEFQGFLSLIEIAWRSERVILKDFWGLRLDTNMA